ncbi:hypothetical protein, partial [Micromonospora sp. NPDC000018]|uniref:hypothetical protein n=1 Tax=Micromonospora sp. NPDC000018 TaxID=3154239 RepID=UPI003328371D
PLKRGELNRPLDHRPGALREGLHHAFMSDTTAEVIAAHHGWTRDAYDELAPDDALRAAHQLPIPPKGIKPDEVEVIGQAPGRVGRPASADRHQAREKSRGRPRRELPPEMWTP